MIKPLLLALAILPVAQAYTLNNNFGASFKDNEINVYIDDQSNCPTAGVTVYDLEEMIGPAMDEFWNTVPTSNLKLRFGGFRGPTTNMTTGRLCAPTDDECITAAGSTVIPPVNDIVISCNTLAVNFGDPNVIAVTIPNNFSGKRIAGAVVLINDSSTIFSTLSESDKIGVIAHEIGHAIGLGHTDDKAALMYYRTVKQRKALGEDDIRGVSYLYPMHVDGAGLLGGCGTIQKRGGTPPRNPPFWQMVTVLALVVGLAELLRLLKRTKTRAAL